MHTTTPTPGAGGHADIVLPFPSPAGGACWPPRRCSVPLELVAAEAARLRSERMNELACAAEAMDADDRAAPSLHEAYDLGHQTGGMVEYRRGWAWGLVCGIVGTIGLAGAIFVVAATAGKAAASSAPQVQPARPVVQA